MVAPQHRAPSQHHRREPCNMKQSQTKETRDGACGSCAYRILGSRAPACQRPRRQVPGLGLGMLKDEGFGVCIRAQGRASGRRCAATCTGEHAELQGPDPISSKMLRLNRLDIVQGMRCISFWDRSPMSFARPVPVVYKGGKVPGTENRPLHFILSCMIIVRGANTMQPWQLIQSGTSVLPIDRTSCTCMPGWVDASCRTVNCARNTVTHSTVCLGFQEVLDQT